MTEGRMCQVHLLDGRNLELLVQPKLLSRELLDLVASHFTLKEKEYFGLSFIDDTGQNNWLQLDRKVLDHDFSKTSGPLELKFLVRFYIEKITYLKENTTVELFYLNAKSLVFNETIEVESEHVFKLAAFALQEARGDYTSGETARSDLKELPVLPIRVLREHPSLNYCEDKVIEHYKKLKGLTRGQTIVQYLALVESLPTYGVHYYPVKDKQGIPWWLGVSYKGVGQYDLQDKLKPRKLFQWKQLENLYFREKKFAVEVNDPHSKTVTKRTFGQTGLVIHTWYASHSLIKTIWVMAISQHQFYLDRKQSKLKMTTARSSGDIAMDLTGISTSRISKLSSIGSKDQLIMASNGSLISAGSADSEVSEEQKKEKIAELKKKEKNLQDTLTQKLEELKKVCLREAELTGRLPKEYPLAAGEKAPQVRRRVGTAFKLDEPSPYDKGPYLKNLEEKFSLQQKFVDATWKLVCEDNLCKTVKKKRRNDYQDALRKLKEIEKEINNYSIMKGKKPTQRTSPILPDDVNPSDLSSLSDSLTLDDDESDSQRHRSKSMQYSPRPHHVEPLDVHYNDRWVAANEQFTENRIINGELQEPIHHYSHHDALSSHNSPLKSASRQPWDARSMPPTPHLTRNACSSTQLRSEDAPQHFRQRSGSLESHSQFLTEPEALAQRYTFSTARRSNSTEVLDDGSSYTSHSSVEYTAPKNIHPAQRHRGRGRNRKDMYANAGSMPNLAQSDTPCYAHYQPARHTTAYCVMGYPPYVEPEAYSNGAYMYNNELEGHYNVNPSYHSTHEYHSQNVQSHYYNDEIDGMTQHPYATLRTRPHRSNEQVSKHIQKASVSDQLIDWYQRKQATYNYGRGSQQSLVFKTMPGSYSHNNRTISFSSMSAMSSTSNWHGHMSGGMTDYNTPTHAFQSYTYNTAPYSHSAHNRSHIDVNQVDSQISNQMHSNLDLEDQIYWHEDSKPGTIV